MTNLTSRKVMVSVILHTGIDIPKRLDIIENIGQGIIGHEN
jgi:ribosomal protein S24E